MIKCKKHREMNITDFLKALITTDSIKIFSITCCTLVTVYLPNSKRHFKNNYCALRYNFLHAALPCSLIPFKTVSVCNYLSVAQMYNVVCY